MRSSIGSGSFVAPNAEDTLDQVEEIFAGANLQTRKRAWHEDGESLVFHIVAMGAKDNHEQLRMKLARSERYKLRRS